MKMNKTLIPLLLTTVLTAQVLTGCGGQTGGSAGTFQDTTGGGNSQSGAGDNGNSSNPAGSPDQFLKTIEENGKETEDYSHWSEHNITLYSNANYDDFAGAKPTLEEVLAAADQVRGIPKDQKAFLMDYLTTLYNFYPELEWRNFTNNLKTVIWDLRDEGDGELAMAGAEAQYLTAHNTIVLKKTIDLENDEMSRIIFRHEIGHMFNYTHFTLGDIDAKFNYYICHDSQSRGKSIMEGMDVIFTTNPYLDQIETDNPGYSVITNFLRVIVDCTDYRVEDSISHNMEYLEKVIDEKGVGSISGRDFVEDCDVMLDTLLSEKYEESAAEREAIYTYIARLYADKYVEEGMSSEQKEEKRNELIKALTLGAPHPEVVDTDAIDRVFREM